MTVSISTLNITIKNATLSINDTHRNNKINTTLSIRALDTVDSDMLSVIMLNVLNNPIMVSDIIFGGIFPKVVMMGVYFAYSLATKKKVLWHWTKVNFCSITIFHHSRSYRYKNITLLTPVNGI
jgi:hypothetical protein